MRPAPQHAKPPAPAGEHASHRAAPASHAKPPRPPTSARRLSRRWLITAVITAAVAVLAPGISYATASQSGSTSASCVGVHPATFPAAGFITDPGRDQGGHTWWNRTASGNLCIGSVVEFVQYNATATKTWRVIAYTTAHPAGQTVASGTFTLGHGWYLFTFRVRQAFAGLSAVCVTASDSFGAPCLRFN